MNKIRATKIFSGKDFLDDRTVLILNQNGQIIDFIISDSDSSDIKFYEGIICPGLVNCHCHLELSHLKNYIPSQTGLPKFIENVVKKRNSFTEHEKNEAMILADKQLFENGINVVGDIMNTMDSLAIKKKSRIYYHSFVEGFDLQPNTSEQMLNEGLDILQKIKLFGLRGSISPHSSYTVSSKYFELMQKHFTNQTVSIHNQECEAELDFLNNKPNEISNFFSSLNRSYAHIQKKADSSFRAVNSYLNSAKNVILAHNVFSTIEDIFASQQGTAMYFWCINILANLYIQNRVPPIELLFNNQCKIVVGTDSLASNWQLNIFSELATIQEYFPQINLKNLLSWATINGAEAMQCLDNFGTLCIGKTPGIILLPYDVKTNQLLKNKQVIRIY